MLEFSNYGKPGFNHWVVEALSTESTLDKNLKIGIIDWWRLDKSEEDIDSIIKFVDSNDLCFFISEEIYFKYTDININQLFGILNTKNVFYISLSEDYQLITPPNPDRTYYIPWFFKATLHIDSDLEIDFDYRPKKYDFNFLPGSEKSNRTILYKLLKDNKHIYSSYYGHPVFKHSSNNDLESSETLQLLTNQDVENNKLNTMVNLYRDNELFALSHCVPTNIYNNTHFDIVSETYVREEHQFLTEKTAKPLATGRFFCWFSSPGMIPYLTKYGFSFTTYDKSLEFDNSADHIIRLERLVKCIEEVAGNEKTVKNIYEQTKEERKHNKDVYEKSVDRFKRDLYLWINQVVENA